VDVRDVRPAGERKGTTMTATRTAAQTAGRDSRLPTPSARSAAEFYRGLIGPATLSVAASRLAVNKAADADTRRFAGFELREATAVVAILQGRGVTARPAGPDGVALLRRLESSDGAHFDRAYVAAQLASHEFLCDLAESYLATATGPAAADGVEAHCRDLAKLALAAFQEHVFVSREIARALGA